MYEPRIYRKSMENGRFEFFNIVIEETDLWIGTGKSLVSLIDKAELHKQILSVRRLLKDYILKYPQFGTSHKPVGLIKDDPEIVKSMKIAGLKSGTGPMAAVAGAIANYAGLKVEQSIPDSEIIVENGGDIFIKMKDDVIIQPFTAENIHFRNLALKITPEHNYISVCSSSGTFGHSYSYGNADLVTVIAEETSLADSWATSFANIIKEKSDIQTKFSDLPDGIIAVMAIKEDTIWYKGPFEFIRL